jgi:DNA-binding LacI/PurR family transcriptional regulator
MAVTIKDVARAAGVSPATVSRALSAPERVSPDARERVRRAVASLGYAPNRAARGLITGRTGNLGLVVPDLANPFFAGVVKGVQARARDAGYSVFVADSDEDPSVETDLVRNLSKQVDGILLCSARMTDDELRATAGETRLVVLNRRVDDIPAVTFDGLGGMRQAVAHLTALGHRRIAYVGGPRTSWSHRSRLDGLRTAIAGTGAEMVDIGSVQPHFSGGVAAADLVLAAGATAVIAYNDVVALGLISRFTARSVDVPGRISVVGFDDIAMSAMAHPPLTTVALPIALSGRTGVDLLLRVIDRPDAAGPVHRELDTHLMVRGSTGPAPHRIAGREQS